MALSQSALSELLKAFLAAAITGGARSRALLVNRPSGPRAYGDVFSSAGRLGCSGRCSLKWKAVEGVSRRLGRP
jgi:hypothetical protein